MLGKIEVKRLRVLNSCIEKYFVKASYLSLRSTSVCDDPFRHRFIQADVRGLRDDNKP